MKYSVVSANSTNAAVISAATAELVHYSVFNNGASAAYVKFYAGLGNTAPTAGTSVPLWRVMVPAGGGVVAQFGKDGPKFNSGLGVTMSTGAADTDSTAVAAAQILLNVWYK